jgi:formyltetrahydrofolate hydrolase
MHDEKARAVLLLSGRGRKGLVAGVSDFVYLYGGNILHADQHADLSTVTRPWSSTERRSGAVVAGVASPGRSS